MSILYEPDAKTLLIKNNLPLPTGAECFTR